MTFHIGSGLFWGWGWLAGIAGIIVLGIFLLPWFFFLLNLQNLLSEVSPANRRMNPGLVWLNFIPVFHLGWFLYTVVKVRDSVSAEYQTRGWFTDGDLGYNVGLTTGILWIAAFFIGWIPLIGWVLPLAGLICWIIYWLKTADLKHRLEGPPVWGRPDAYPPVYPPGTSPYNNRYPQPYAPPPGAPGAPPAGQPPTAPGAPQAGQPQPGARPAAQGPSVEGQGTTAERLDERAAGAASGSSGENGTAETDSRERACGACGSKFDPGDRFCRSCGLPLP